MAKSDLIVLVILSHRCVVDGAAGRHVTPTRSICGPSAREMLNHLTDVGGLADCQHNLHGPPAPSVGLFPFTRKPIFAKMNFAPGSSC